MIIIAVVALLTQSKHLTVSRLDGTISFQDKITHDQIPFSLYAYTDRAVLDVPAHYQIWITSGKLSICDLRRSRRVVIHREPGRVGPAYAYEKAIFPILADDYAMCPSEKEGKQMIAALRRDLRTTTRTTHEKATTGVVPVTGSGVTQITYWDPKSGYRMNVTWWVAEEPLARPKTILASFEIPATKKLWVYAFSGPFHQAADPNLKLPTADHILSINDSDLANRSSRGKRAAAWLHDLRFVPPYTSGA